MKRIQRKRTKGWKMPPNTVYVGRPSKWGNPFTGADAVEKYKTAIENFSSDEIEGYEAWRDWNLAGGDSSIISGLSFINRDVELNNTVKRNVEAVIKQLRGKNLACWCPLDKPCHADILLEVVNKI